MNNSIKTTDPLRKNMGYVDKNIRPEDLKHIKFSEMPKVRTSVRMPLNGTTAYFSSFSCLGDSKEHLAISFCEHDKLKSIPLIRIHSECLTGDLFQSDRCDCGNQLQESIASLKKQRGLLLYLRQEGRGIGLYQKMEAYVLQDKGFDTYEANQALGADKDGRNYEVAANMLKALGIYKIDLLTNNPVKVAQLKQYGIEVHKVVPTKTYLNNQNEKYLEAKKRVCGHTLDIDGGLS
ncbi:MAG TPA: GTP cyclohydrolase II RibA [Oligoflexia bacterium]|nr:GTP cyclohydrolase II RibA [Oligoflexia bacterium]HMR25457.1 GTP cyclohydrolase II RibA [Oligoflexia bacterium]